MKAYTLKTMNRTLLSALLAVLACTPIYGTVSVSPEEMNEASRWMAAKFQGVVAAGRLLKSSLFKPDNYGSYHDAAYWTRFTFWWPNLLTALESLRPLRFPNTDPDIRNALNWFTENQQPDGLWKIEQDKEVKNSQKADQLWLSLRICRMLKKYWG